MSFQISVYAHSLHLAKLTVNTRCRSRGSGTLERMNDGTNDKGRGRSGASDVADLFSSAGDARFEQQAPLSHRMRPRSLDDLVGQDHLVGPGRLLRRAIEADR